MLLIFDLDGTLIDSSRDLAISTNATRAHFGLAPLDAAVVNSYVGNGAAVLIEKAVGVELEKSQGPDALAFFLAYYRAHSLEHTRLYSGIEPLLEELAAGGHSLGVLTNKPERISRDILGALGVRDKFFRIYGGNGAIEKKPSPCGVLAMSEESGVPLDRVLMIGDSSVDVQTARNAAVRSCGVTWGFQPESFSTWPPDYLIDAPDQLLSITETRARSIQPS